MVWLVAHIWVGLALAALFGLLFGWAFRGLMLKGRARDAIVARDIALTELNQSRLEIDQLYAAQSKGVDAAAQAGDDTLRLELEAREEKLQSLGQELAASRSELEDLKSKAVIGAGAVVAGAAGAVGAALSGGEETTAPSVSVPETRLDAGLNLSDASLQWRNRYLTSRVRSLEAKSVADPVDQETDTSALDAASLRAEQAEAALETLKAEAEEDKKKMAATALATSAASAVGGAALSGGADDLRLVKQTWQNNYLRRRFADVSGLSSESEPAPAAAVDAPVPTDETSDPIAAEKQAWQSQYLRQRLAYMEDNPPGARPIAQSLEDQAEEASGEETPADEGGTVVADIADASNVPQEAAGLEQELARLRWRNRYLEGRLAYIDGDAPKSDAEIAAQSMGTETEPDEATAKVSEPETQSVAENTPQAPTPAESVLAAMESSHGLSEQTSGASSDGVSKPNPLFKPRNGGDDLTRIEGVEPAIAMALNQIGIWHYHQIAGWTHENSNWINANLEAEGQVQAQDWVSQAGALSLGADID